MSQPNVPDPDGVEPEDETAEPDDGEARGTEPARGEEAESG